MREIPKFYQLLVMIFELDEDVNWLREIIRNWFEVVSLMYRRLGQGWQNWVKIGKSKRISDNNKENKYIYILMNNDLGK